MDNHFRYVLNTKKLDKIGNIHSTEEFKTDFA